MGQYHIYVNPAKKQYIDPARFEENMTAITYLQGLHAEALALLVVNPSQLPHHNYGALAGAWFGDLIYAAGDDYGSPNDFSIKTATEEDPDRNLNRMAHEEYEDISYWAIVHMCEGRYDDILQTSGTWRSSGPRWHLALTST